MKPEKKKKTDIILPYTAMNDIGLEGIDALTSRHSISIDRNEAIRAAAQGHIDTPVAQTVHIHASTRFRGFTAR